MPAPLIAGGALLGGGLLGTGLFGKQGGGPSPINTRPLNDTVARGRDEQQNIIRNLRSQLQPITDRFGTQLQETLAATQGKREALGNKFRADVEAGLNREGSQLFRTLSEQALRNVPAIQNQLRETLAATGGLQRGSANVALSQPLLDANAAITQGAQDIALQNQQFLNQNLQRTFELDDNFLQQELGINRDVLIQALNSGREDLIQEATLLLDEAQQRQADLLGIDQFAISGQIAQDAAKRQERLQRQSDLIGAGSSILGGFLGRG